MINEPQSSVSSDDELLILVDEDDRETGHLTKDRCHDGGGILHRAFSIFLFDESGNLLLQQRAADKRLWPGYWSNSCCSHPRRGESLDAATERRMVDELNVNATLEFVYKFIYRAHFGELGSEYELCSVFLGRETQRATPNETEIEAVRYLSRTELDTEFSNRGDEYTPWFRLEWEALCTQYTKDLARYTDGR